MVIPKKRSDQEIQQAQEVINKNEFIYQTNQSLQILAQGIVSLSLQIEKTRAQSSSDNKALMIDLENLKEEVLHRVKVMESSIGDIVSEILEIRKNLDAVHEDIKVQDQEMQDCQKSIGTNRDRICDLEDRVSITRRDCERGVETLKIQVKEQLSLMSLALSSKPWINDDAEDKMLRVMHIWRVDFDGLVREIGLIKKDMAYGEKKFENIYTLIDRLKGGSH